MKWNSWSAITATTGLIILFKINIHIRDDSNMGRHSYWSTNSIWGFKSLSAFAMKTFTLIQLLQNCSWVAFYWFATSFISALWPLNEQSRTWEAGEIPPGMATAGITRTDEQIFSILCVIYTDVSHNCPDLTLAQECWAKLMYKLQLWNFQAANKVTW